MLGSEGHEGGIKVSVLAIVEEGNVKCEAKIEAEE
jgi:hypothetical protein